MSTSQHDATAAQHEVRAPDYMTRLVHGGGDDLEQVEAALRGHEGASVLDLGCGDGDASYRTAPHVAQVVACDTAGYVLDAVAATAAGRGLRNITVQRAVPERLPFPDASFDAVLCRFAVHRWHDLNVGLWQARRVIKSGGLALFIDAVAPADPVLDTHLQAVELLRDASHVRNYSVSELAAALTRAGFALDGITVRRLHLEFAAWVAQTRTPAVMADAIRALWTRAPSLVRERFAVGGDGSFDLAAATFQMRAA